MKTIRADLAASHVVIMAIDESGAERAHVIADDGGASFSQLRAALEAAAGDVAPRASAGAPAVEVMDDPIEFDDPIPTGWGGKFGSTSQTFRASTLRALELGSVPPDRHK